MMLLLVMSNSWCSNSLSRKIPPFEAQISTIPINVQNRMKQYTWHQNCPVALSELSYVRLSYWGFDNQQHLGVMVVNKKLASEIVTIFKKLYYQKFPIQQIELMDKFNGDDNAAMAANNTSAFNCRVIMGTHHFSKHSYGAAIDINPLLNPYVQDNQVLPPAGQHYLNRSQPVAGMIILGNSIYHEFISRGWKWGGSWTTHKDYHHFEKSMT